MSDNDFPGLAGERLGFDLREMMGLRQGLSGTGLSEMMRSGKLERLIPKSFGVMDPMAPEKSGWLYDGTQPPETFGV